MPLPRPSLRRSTIASRLAILVSLPLLGGVALVAMVAGDAQDDMWAAQGLRRDAELVEVLSEIAVTLDVNADGYDAFLVANDTTFRMPDGVGSQLVSPRIWEESGLIELIPQLEARRGHFTDVDLADSLVGDLEAFVEQLRSSDRPAGAELDELRLVVGRDVDQALAAQLTQLESHLGTVDPPTELLSLHAAIGSARDLRAAAREQRTATALYLLPIADDENGSNDDRLRELIASTARYESELSTMATTLPDDQRDRLGVATAGPQLVRYRTLIEDAIGGRAQPIDEDDLAMLTTTGVVIFVDGLSSITQLSSFNAELTADFVDATAKLEAEANARLTKVVLLATLMAAVMISIGFVIIRSITNPVGGLLERARRITDGQLDPIRAAGSGGPADIAQVHQALDEMTANLTTLSEQAEALSAGRLDDEVLSRKVAGRLGQSLHGSVDRLRSMTARMEREATHDALTGLPNRAAVMALLDHLLTGPQTDRRPVAVVMLDLDGFKQANDNMGHAIGDEVLCHVGHRLVTRSQGHFVARLGGDEFMMVVTAETDSDPFELARRITRAIGEPMRLSVGTVHVSASAGLVRTDDSNWLTPAEILRRVDLALYEAKADTPGAVVEFDQRLHDSLLASTKLSGELAAALSRNEFFLAAQPIIAVDRGALHGFEALLRWRSPLRGLVPPEMFIGVAEQSELITHIDTWVIQESAKALSSWQATPGLEELSLSVNVSARHLSRPELPIELERAISEHGIRPDAYVIEITESQLIPNLARAEDNLRRLKDLGVSVAIDDFGTGYASVAHLRSVDFDRLKIDRSFLTDLDNETDRSLASLLVSLGRDLHLDVVAEGIETPEQLRWARDAGCSHGQGFLFGRPRPIGDITPDCVAELSGRAVELSRAHHAAP